jgi:protein involved in polysaccharide export with SLBB domain
MAYTAGNLFGLVNAPPGRMVYRYDSTDSVSVVEVGGYFNNSDDDLNLDSGDLIHVVVWDGTPFASGQVPTGYGLQIVTTVDAAGAVNTAEAGISTAGALSTT